MPSRPWIFICPSSRGIGLQLTRHLLQTTTLPILATTRSQDLEAAKSAILSGPSRQKAHQAQDQDEQKHQSQGQHQHQHQHHERLHKQAHRLHLTHLDVTDEPSIRKASQHARKLFPPQTHHLHLSFAIPGVLTPEKSPAQIDAEASMAMFQVNCAGPLLLAKHFVEFMPRKSTVVEGDMLRGRDDGEGDAKTLPEHATWVFMSARVGSVTDNKLGGWYSYRASKAAVNSVTKSLDLMLGARSGGRALAMAYHPGTVRTDFSREFWGSMEGRGGGGGFLEVEEAVERMVGVVRGLHVSRDRGRCLDWRGEVIPP
ncbi:hypothetical protein E4U21_007285 [Claviceps maximensis]|nr:hypothetical protein E4U21_007285 [Claviceps maximensis]